MAKLDPETQARISAVLVQFAASCNRMRDAATAAQLALIELGTLLDAGMIKSAQKVADAAIQTAKEKRDV